MKLQQYLKTRKISLRQMHDDLVALFGDAPAYTTLGYIAAGRTEPRIELALMILRWSNGSIKMHELMVNRRRKYTSADTPIYGLNETPQKEGMLIEDTEAEPVSNKETWEDMLDNL